MLKKSIFISIASLLIFSCKNFNNNCSFPEFSKIRNNEVKLNNSAERSLQVLSENYSLLQAKPFDDNFQNEITINFYFSITSNPNESFFFIEKSQSNYLDFKKDILLVTSFAIPLSEIDINSFLQETHSTYVELYQTNTTLFSIGTKYNNPSIYLKMVSYDDGKEKITQCEKRQYLFIEMKTEDVIKIKAAFKTFLENYKN